MSGVFAIGLLIIAFILTSEKRRRQHDKFMDAKLKESNKKINELELKLTKLIQKYATKR